MAEVTELRDLSPEQVVEAANGVLAAKLHIDDPAEAARRLVELAKLDPGMTAEIEALARDAARSDPELLGGLVVRVGDWQFDGTVRGRLNQLKNQLLERSSHEIQGRRDRFSTL